nr:serine carboxypeptidase II-3-like [Tanacetum cinerariifolium]
MDRGDGSSLLSSCLTMYMVKGKKPELDRRLMFLIHAGKTFLYPILTTRQCKRPLMRNLHHGMYAGRALDID